MKKSWMSIFMAAAVLSVLADFLLRGGEADGAFWWSHLWGFFTLFGFLGCVAIIVISKMLGHYWLKREESYYNNEYDH